MIGRLRGTVVAADGDVLTVECDRVGYEVEVPKGKGGERPEHFFIHTHVTEGAIRLLGFANESDRAMFRRLISLSGVGPSTALALLGGLEAAALTRAIVAKDVALLTKIKGVGKKTAERLVVELHDKLEQTLFDAVGSDVLARRSTLEGALVRLGFREKEVARVLDAIGSSRIRSTDLGELVKEALQALATPAVMS